MDEAERQARSLADKLWAAAMRHYHAGHECAGDFDRMVAEIVAPALRTALAAQARAEEENRKFRDILADIHKTLRDNGAPQEGLLGLADVGIGWLGLQMRKERERADTLAQLGDRLHSALERVKHIVRLVLTGRPARDVTEAFGEADSALSAWTKARGKGEG